MNIFFSQAHISFSPTLEQQRKCPGCEGTIIDGDFIIKYDVKREESLGEIQVSGQDFAAAHKTYLEHSVIFFNCLTYALGKDLQH